MKYERNRGLLPGIALLAGFVMWTILIQHIDVQAAGPEGTAVGFATLNLWFHQLTGTHMTIYTVTDWLGLVPIVTALCFGILGFIQLIKRRSLLRVDPDILLLGAYYMIVILCYLVFEMIPVNYRPVLIEGKLEASYPSSTTLLVLSVMPTLIFQMNRRIKRSLLKKMIAVAAAVFSLFMLIGRLTSGVHWLTDITGSILLSSGLFIFYRSFVLYMDKKKTIAPSEARDGV